MSQFKKKYQKRRPIADWRSHFDINHERNRHAFSISCSQPALKNSRHYPFWQKIAHIFIPHEKNGFKPHAVHHHALISYSLLLISAKVIISILLFSIIPNEASFSTLTSQRVIELTNEARQAVGIAPLTTSPLLERSAGLKADEMTMLGYFAHNNPSGETPWEWFKRVGYEYTYAGENLAMDFREAEEVVQAWMESPKHRENLINPKYKEIGVSVTTGEIEGKTVTLIVQHFGTSFASFADEPKFIASSAASQSIEGLNTEVAAASTEVKFAPLQRIPITKLLTVALWIFAGFALWLSLQVFFTLFIKLRVQHRATILASVAVIALAVGLMFFNIHFIENIGPGVIIF